MTPRTRNLRWKERIDRLRKKAPGGVLGDFSEAGAKEAAEKGPGMGILGHFSEAGAKARPFIISGLRHD